MNLKTLSSEGKIAYLIKPILKVLQEAGGQLEHSRIKRPNKQQLVAFKTRLEDAGLEVKLRESRGNRIKAACGQLVSEYNRQGKKTANRTVNGTENSNGSVRKSSFTGRASSKRHPFAKHKNVGKKRKHE